MAENDTQIDDSTSITVDSDAGDSGYVDSSEIDVTKQSDADFMADTIKDIKATQDVILGEGDDDVDYSDNGVDSGGSDDVLPELAGTDIPDVYSDAAEASGMSPQEIIDYANAHTDAELIEEAAAIREALKLLDEQDNQDDVTKQDNKKTGDNDNKGDEPSEAEKQMLERVRKQLQEEFGASLKEIEDFKASQEEQSTIQTVGRASELFDKASEEFPVFGKTDELPKFPSGRLAGQLIPTSPQMKARLEVLRFADAFMAAGADIDNAMANALATYKGLHLEKELERKQVRDLKNHQIKLSGAHVGKETKRKYADTRDEIIDDIKQLKRAAGYD